MKYYFHEKAEAEFLKAIEYYENCKNGLGIKFAEEVYAAIKRACDFPHAWTKIDYRTHRCLTNKFPYGILYRIMDDHIRIMAVMNLHRKPDYWIKRQ